MVEELRKQVEKIVKINDAEWAAFQSILKPKQIKKNELFLEQGKVCRHMAFIAKGYVRFYFLVGAVEVTKEFSFENSFCGSYASFITGNPSRFNVKAMEDLSLLIFDRHHLLELVDQYPAWAKFLLLSVENLFVRKENREASFLLDSPEERYEKLLSENKEMLQRVPLKYIASYLGLSAETLSRIRARHR
jgi:CRP-like cAMP-binding protein